MATLNDIQRQIGAVKKTKQITKAMNMVAAAKLRGAQGKMESFEPYASKFAETLGNLASGTEPDIHPLLVKREHVSKVEMLHFTGDRGLCGSFNTNLISKAEKWMKELNTEKNIDCSLTTVGKKGRDYFNKLKIKEYSNDAENLISQFNSKISNLTNLIESRIANSSSLGQSLTNTGELTSDYITKVTDLKEKIADAKSDANIAKRKTYYDSQDAGWWCSFNNFLKIVFWIMFVVYMVIAVIYKQYDKQHVRVGAVLFPALMYFDIPGILYTVVKKIFSIL